MSRREQLIVVRGGGDIATGTIYKLSRCGYPVLILEAEYPSAIRRKAAFSEAVYDGSSRVEDMSCIYVKDTADLEKYIGRGAPVMITDPKCRILEELKPWALVDAILAKKNLGTHRGMAEKTIGLGPGFEAGKDVDLVIETMRGNDLGRLIEQGRAMANTGVPGMIGGYDKERVIHSPAKGQIRGYCEIGDKVKRGQKIADILTPEGEIAVEASLTGILRGMIRNGYEVTKGFKIADIDPREGEYKNCFRISDKARCIAGGVLEGLLYLEEKRRLE